MPESLEQTIAATVDADVRPSMEETVAGPTSQTVGGGPMPGVELDATQAATDLDATVAAPRDASVPLAPATATATDKIGRYVALSRLGAGAMGVVLAAYDPELDRKVALKLLKPRGGDPQAARLRLQREAQALAKLGHPNVVAVHDVGMHGEQLFVAMEFVAGQTLGEWIEASPRPRPWAEVIELFRAAGRGLAAAHQAGLVHRDFKPDNVMLGDDGRVRVMDFGLARATEAEPDHAHVEVSAAQLELSAGKLSQPVTQTGALLGTPAYMAPEQFSGRADAASDQFGFCIALYEALYGERPFVGSTLAELMAAVCLGEPRPAPRGVEVPGWIRKILMRGLSKRPEDRFASMQALLDALADDPAVRRRRWSAAAAIVALLGGASWGIVSQARDQPPQPCAGLEAKLAGVWDADRRAAVEASMRASKLSYAADTSTRVRDGLDAWTQAWVAARVDACEANQRGEQSDTLLDLRMACLDRQLARLEASVEVFAAADDDVVSKAAAAVYELPRVAACSDVEALRADTPPPDDPELAARVAELEQRMAVADALHATGKYRESLAEYDAIVAAATELGYEPLAAEAWLGQGQLQIQLARYDDAEATLKRAYDAALAQRMLDSASAAALSSMHLHTGYLARYADAHGWALHADPLTRATGSTLRRSNYEVALGRLALAEGEFAEGQALLERALASMTEALGPDHFSLVGVLSPLASTTARRGELVDARALAERALAIYEAALGPDHPDLASALFNLGSIEMMTGDREIARGRLERALAIQTAALGADHPDLAFALNNLGNMAFGDGDYPAALGYYQRTLEIREQALGPDSPEVALALNNLGVLAAKQRDFATARERYGRALAIREAALGPEHPDVAVSLHNLGVTAYRQGDLAAARELHGRALAIREAALGPEHPDVAASLNELGLVLLELGERREASRVLERSLALRTGPDANPVKPAHLAETRFALARALGPGQRARARELAELARAAFAEAGPGSSAELEQVEAWLRSR